MYYLRNPKLPRLIESSPDLIEATLGIMISKPPVKVVLELYDERQVV